MSARAPARGPIRCAAGDPAPDEGTVNSNTIVLTSGPAMLRIPAAALTTQPPVAFRMDVLPGGYLILDIQAVNHESYDFAAGNRPVLTINLNGQGCPANLPGVRLVRVGADAPTSIDPLPPDPLDPVPANTYRFALEGLSLFVLAEP